MGNGRKAVNIHAFVKTTLYDFYQYRIIVVVEPENAVKGGPVV
jgi:hypothetical protein